MGKLQILIKFDYKIINVVYDDTKINYIVYAYTHT